MGKSQRRKGYVFENNLVHKLKEFNVTFAKRNLMSGAIEGWKGDIKFKVADTRFCIEAKAWKRLAIFRFWDKLKNEVAGEIPILALKEDYSDVLICMSIDEFGAFLEAYEFMHKNRGRAIITTDPELRVVGDDRTKHQKKEIQNIINKLEQLKRGL